jgi:phosphodiesterase/alkaline phosphatase D-like protein
VVSTYLAPVISGLGASSVSNTSETVSATINPENAATSYFFAYGTSPTSLTTTTTPKVLAAGVTGIPVSATLTGLQANTTYYYRITAKSLGGQVIASTLSFITP